MTPTLGQIAFEAYVKDLPFPPSDFGGSDTWDELLHAEQMAWQRAAVAVATFLASRPVTSDIFNDFAPHVAGTEPAGAFPFSRPSGEVRV